jgi:hypothetical protein
MLERVSPDGSVSATVTVPPVAADPVFVTLIVYVAPVCPCVKFPEWLLVIDKKGPALLAFSIARTWPLNRTYSFDSTAAPPPPDELMLVGSLAVLPAEPPPETVAEFVTLFGAEFKTLTVRVILG